MQQSRLHCALAEPSPLTLNAHAVAERATVDHASAPRSTPPFENNTPASTTSANVCGCTASNEISTGRGCAPECPYDAFAELVSSGQGTGRGTDARTPLQRLSARLSRLPAETIKAEVMRVLAAVGSDGRYRESAASACIRVGESGEGGIGGAYGCNGAGGGEGRGLAKCLKKSASCGQPGCAPACSMPSMGRVAFGLSELGKE
eukprot:1035623-Pleurochrysis_carterae.AAC.1